MEKETPQETTNESLEKKINNLNKKVDILITDFNFSTIALLASLFIGIIATIVISGSGAKGELAFAAGAFSILGFYIALRVMYHLLCKIADKQTKKEQ